MLMQHIGVGYFGYYRATAYAMKHSLMPEIAKLRMKALNFWDKHGIRAAADAFDVSTRTLYWWRRLLRTGGPEALIPRSKAPLVRRSRHWHPDVLKEIRRLRTELPNLGKEQIFVRLKPWCEARHFTCPSTSTIGRIIAGAHDKMRMIPVRLSARGKARLIKKRSVKPRRPKQYRPVKTGELIGMDAIELRMGDLRRYIITMIDEHSDYALALAVPSLNSDITSHFFSKATKLFPVAIRQVVTDNGKEFLGNFDKTLQEASIKHIWTYPYTPKMNATCERFNRTLREQFIEFNELLLFEDLNLFNQRMAEYLVLYNSKRPHKSLELMTPVDYILRESKNCNMWWTHTKTLAHHLLHRQLQAFGIKQFRGRNAAAKRNHAGQFTVLEKFADGGGLEFTRAGGETPIVHTIFLFCLVVVLIILALLQVLPGGAYHAGAILFSTLSPGQGYAATRVSYVMLCLSKRLTARYRSLFSPPATNRRAGRYRRSYRRR